MVKLLVQSGVSESFASGESGTALLAARVKSPQIRAHLSTQDGHARTHIHYKIAQQSRGGVMDRDRKTEGGASSEPAFDVSQVCLRVRNLFDHTSEFAAVGQIERGQGGARLEHPDVTCGTMTAVGVFL